jgi:hypothetical protein
MPVLAAVTTVSFVEVMSVIYVQLTWSHRLPLVDHRAEEKTHDADGYDVKKRLMDVQPSLVILVIFLRTVSFFAPFFKAAAAAFLSFSFLLVERITFEALQHAMRTDDRKREESR